ncbi:BlaI/MecI/CopY family transcriptional regulator [uncultured Jatrophihabitans sp.]|uniref:BlaI/MecI/CopY family transcriptional regulator n=1 Tax=uncultured Jatrophihabitans sp. TaxID=1610747 RepID=UPI0035CA96C7
MATRRSPGALEQEILAALAAGTGPMSPSQVQAELPGELAYTTVMTTLSRMHGKRALTRQQRGRGYVYALPDDADTARASMAAFQMQRLLDHESDRAGVLTQFVANLEADDEALLQQLLQRSATQEPT